MRNLFLGESLQCFILYFRTHTKSVMDYYQRWQVAILLKDEFAGGPKTAAIELLVGDGIVLKMEY